MNPQMMSDLAAARVADELRAAARRRLVAQARTARRRRSKADPPQ